jgi:hypothetical protein
MDLNNDQRMLEAILCTLLAQTGGEITLSLVEIAGHSCGWRICPKADGQGQTLTLTLERVPARVESLARLTGPLSRCNKPDVS